MKKFKTKEVERAKSVEKVIRDAWDSLDSHLPYTYEKHHDSPEFHKECVRKYAEAILEATKLY